MTHSNCWISGCGRIDLTINLDDALACSHSGQCDSDVEWLRQQPYIIEQLSGIKPKLLINILREYGAWDDGDLADHEANLDRLVWIACCDTAENIQGENP
jgi:hypothetical protein